MQLELEGKVAVVTGASRGIGLAVMQALTAEGVHVVAGARTTRTSSTRSSRPGRSSSSRRTSARLPLRVTSPRRRSRTAEDGRRGRGPDRHPRQQRRRGAPAPRRLPQHHRRGLGRIREPQPDGGGPNDPRRPALHAGGRRWVHRHHQLGQCLPARPCGPGLQRGQGGCGELLEVTVEGGGRARDPGEHGEPGTGGHGAVARRRTAWPRRSPAPPVGIPMPWHRAPPPIRPPAGSRLPKRWRTSSCSSPVPVPPTSPALTSPSTEASSRRSDLRP